MKIRQTLAALVGAAVALSATVASAQIVITVSDATAAAGGTATFDVTLSGVAAGGTAANNAQLDIIFPSAVFDVATAAAACTLDPRLAALNHTESLPTSPNPGEGNRRLRLSVIDSLDPLGEVTDGKLYTCNFPVKADAPSGAVTLTATRQNVGDTAGNVLASSTVSGTVTVEGGGGGCPAITPVPTPTTGIFIQAGSVEQVAPGGTATFDVTLSGVAAGGTLANNAQVDIIFPSAVFDIATGPGACTLDPRLSALNHTESLPTSPNPGEGNRRLRLSVIDSLDPLGEVTDGRLYTCNFPVKADAPVGEVTLTATRQNVGDTSGNVLTSTTVNGVVVVCTGGGNPATPTSTPTSTPTNTEVPPTVTPTNTTAQPTLTPTTVPPTRTPTRGSTGGIEDEDGCQMTTTSSSSAWALLVPVMMAFALRRRSN